MRGSNVQRPISKVLLDGLYDPDCILFQLRGCQHLMRRIWDELLLYWARAIRLPQKDLEKGEYMGWEGGIEKADEARPQPFYLTPIDMDPDVGGYGFPVGREDTKDPININMMPFIAGADFEECKLPECVRPYWSLIQACLGPEMDRSWHHLWPSRRIPSEKGKVNYLTIQVIPFDITLCHRQFAIVILLHYYSSSPFMCCTQESWVDEGSSQRRPGLHVDSPGGDHHHHEDHHYHYHYHYHDS